ncbi:MAG: hypothetical protein Ct9H90mP14_3560 [Methanobacteriota archaeon]|nr:MAG: hypothetical protein Ct9H90mP14_3560 [Euryarchaeota archaeon]
MAAERGVVPLDQATELLKRSTIFPQWTEEDTLAVLRVLDDRWLLRLIEQPRQSDPTIWHPKLWQGLAKKANVDARPADLVPGDRPPWERNTKRLRNLVGDVQWFNTCRSLSILDGFRLLENWVEIVPNISQ